MNGGTGNAALIGAVVAIACLTAAAEARTEGGGWFARLFAAPSFDEAAAKVETPKTAAKLVRQYVKYQEDMNGDVWSDGHTTWERGYGDCEDMAAAVVDLCKKAGIAGDATIQVFSRGGCDGHAVAMGTWEGRKWMGC